MFTKLLSKKIQEKLKARERALAWRTNQANQNIPDGALKPSDVINRSTFVRMCSNKEDITKNKIIAGGLLENGKMKFGYSELYNKTQNQGDRPIAGIKNIEVSYTGDFKGLRKATVNWSVNSNDELNELTPHFLALGQTVILDWGWVSKESKGLTVDLGVAPFITFDSEGSVKVKQDIFQNPQEIIQEAGGDYDAIGGTVSNFEYSLRTDGGYDCITYITALGSTLYKKPMDKSGNKTDVIRINDVDGIQTSFDGLINTLINLRDIIIYDILGVEYSTSWFTGRAYKKLRDNVIEFASDKKNKSKVIYSENTGGYGDNTTLVDSKENPNIMWILRPLSKDDIFVKWGWMEDQLLNRYISYMGGDDKEIKLTIRSIDTVLHTKGDKEGQPISTKNLKDEDKEKYGLKDIPEEYLGKVVKTPTLIRNSKLLYPINVFKFFNVEKLPQQANVEIPGEMYGRFEKGDKTYIDNFFKMLQRIKIESFATAGRKADTFKVLDGDGKFGKLRSMWVNIKEIQSAFGVKEDGSVTPIGTLETGIENLYVALNSNFHNYWDFALVADPYDSTNLKVIDKRTSSFGAQNYTTYQGGTDDEEGKSSHEVQKLGIYKFPSYKIGSIVKNQSMTFKIPDSMQQSILFSANSIEGQYKPVSHINNPDLARLFRFDKNSEEVIEYSDRYLKDIKTAYNSKKEQTTTTIGEELDIALLQTKIGSYNTNPSSKIGFDAGKGPISINPKAVWWKRWTGTDIQEPEEIEDGLSDRKPIVRFQITENSEIATYEEMTVDRKIATNTTYFSEKRGATVVPSYTEETLTAVDKFEEKLGPAKTLFYKMAANTSGDFMPVMKNDAATVISNFLNKNNPSVVIPTELSLEVDGIGGVMPGDIIQTDYIQPIYNKTLYHNGVRQGPFTYFQIVESNQKVDSSGWTTDISTKMRLNDVIIDEGTTTTKPLEQDTTPAEEKVVEEKPKTNKIVISATPEQELTFDSGTVEQIKDEEVVVENTFEPGQYVTLPKKKLPEPTIPEDFFDMFGRPTGFVQGSYGKFDVKHTPMKMPGPNIKPREKREKIKFTTLFGKVHDTYGPTAIFYWDDSWGPRQQPSGFYPAWRKTDDRYSRALWFIAKGELSRDDVKSNGSTIREIGEKWAQRNPEGESSRGNYYVVGNGKNDYPGPKYIIDNAVRKLPISNYPSPNTSNTIRINQAHPATGRTGFLDVDVTDIKE